MHITSASSKMFPPGSIFLNILNAFLKQSHFFDHTQNNILQYKFAYIFEDFQIYLTTFIKYQRKTKNFERG